MKLDSYRISRLGRIVRPNVLQMILRLNFFKMLTLERKQKILLDELGLTLGLVSSKNESFFKLISLKITKKINKKIIFDWPK